VFGGTDGKKSKNGIHGYYSGTRREDEVKARAAFIQLYPVWRAREISIETKLTIFKSNVKSVLRFTCETWKSTKKILKDLQTFTDVSGIFFQDRLAEHNYNISNELWSLAHETPLEEQIKCRKWIGHTLEKVPQP
jgi:hypothetical protein